MDDAFDYAKQKWDKSHKVPDFKVGDPVQVSTLSFNNIKGQKKFKDSYVGPFIIVSLYGNNSVQVELSVELENKHPTFPVSLIKLYQPADKELCPLRNPTPFTVPPVEQSEDKKDKETKGDKRHQREPENPASEASEAWTAPKIGTMVDLGPISILKPFGNLVTKLKSH
ncbi:hypothetical protein O181_076079 [Austropuccinia psidii MF-1]|uniref:Tf2-1-like SH3-like domain-containing protein n=1 Tax=Austropuccinia psidii MF-1 TaxID=1389203 RepID=A0A9Q3IF30_9BASI|nr:hypothetical protein [Austropuccinia psidii MF-1]